jgi:hypothetical protein
VGLAADPLTTPPANLAALDVRFTIVAGRVVYEQGRVTTPPSTIGPESGPGSTTRPPPPTIGPAPAPKEPSSPKKK